MRRQPPIHPFALPLLALTAAALMAGLYGLFGIGKDALMYAFSALVVFAMPVVVVFGVTGIVLGIRRLLTGGKP